MNQRRDLDPVLLYSELRIRGFRSGSKGTESKTPFSLSRAESAVHQYFKELKPSHTIAEQFFLFVPIPAKAKMLGLLSIYKFSFDGT
jgi:hypothetical protein